MQSGLFGANVLHPYCNHPTFHFPLPSSWAYFHLSGIFFYRWWRRRLRSFRGNWYVTVWARGWKYSIYHDVIAVFMNTNNISAHIAVRESLVQVAEKLQIIVVGGCFHCLCNEQVIICGSGYFSVKKSLEIWCVLFFDESLNPPDDACSLKQNVFAISFIFTWTFLWPIMNSHSSPSLSPSHTVVWLLRAFADLSNLFTSQIQSRCEMWIMSVSMVQPAGRTWTHLPPSPPFIYILILHEPHKKLSHWMLNKEKVWCNNIELHTFNVPGCHFSFADISKGFPSAYKVSV